MKRAILIFIALLLAACNCSPTKAAERQPPPKDAKAIEQIVQALVPMKGFGCIQTAQFNISGRQVFAVWYDPFSGRAACYLYAYYFDHRTTRWIQFVDRFVDHSSDLSAECKPDTLVFRNERDEVVLREPLAKVPAKQWWKEENERSSAATDDGPLVFEGTVATIEISPLPESLRNFIIIMRVDRVVQGQFSGKTFQFRIHSPSLSGLKVGKTYTVEAKRTADGYTVDEFQWMERERLKASKPPGGPKPLVAALFTAGREVVIRPDLQKLAAHGLTVQQLDPVRRKRLVSGIWTVKLGGKEVNLAEVATLAERDLQTPPFTTPLPDGREAFVSPDAKRVGRYLVTGEAFEEDVRCRLADPFVDDPAKVCVLVAIPVPGGHVPNHWGSDHIHISNGEPLDTFAKVELRGRPGPQAADLLHMRKVRRHLAAALELAKGVPRTQFEKRFGPGIKQHVEPDPHFRVVPATCYKLGSQRLSVFFEDDGSTVEHIAGSSDLRPPNGGPQDISRQARAVADVERTMLLQFLTKCYGQATLPEKTTLAAFLDRTASDLKWTPQEREQVLGSGR